MRKIVPLLVTVVAASFALAQHSSPPHPRTGPSRLSMIAMIDLPGRPGFEDAAFANNLIVISQTDANTIDVFDPQKRRLVAQVNNIAQPRGIAVDAKKSRIYVATAGSVINVISSQDWEVKDSFHVDGSPDVLALSANGLRLYVGDKLNATVAAVDTSLRKTIASAHLPGRPEEIALGDDDEIYVTVQDQALIVGIDPQMKVMAEFKLNGSQPAGLVYDPAAHRLYVAVRSAVLAINSNNGTEVGRVAAPQGIQSLFFNPASHTLFGAGGGSVISVDTAGGFTALDELPADVKGHTLIYDPGRKLLFLPGGREGRSKMMIVKNLSPGAAREAPPSEAKLQ